MGGRLRPESAAGITRNMQRIIPLGQFTNLVLKFDSGFVTYPNLSSQKLEPKKGNVFTVVEFNQPSQQRTALQVI